MRKLYGDSLRKDAGFVKVIKSVAKRNVRLLESHAKRHAPELRMFAQEVHGTFRKVYGEASEVVEEFLAQCEWFFLVRLESLSHSDLPSWTKDF